MAVAVQDRISNGRGRALVVPREHGAWGILLVPLVTGAAVGARSMQSGLAVMLFTVAALSLFWLRTPLESYLGAGPVRVQSDSEAKPVLTAMAVLASVAAFCLMSLFLMGHAAGLLVLGAACGGVFIIQAALKKLGRRYSMAAQIIGSIGLTATAPAAYYVSTGTLNETAAALWVANFAFAANQIHFVQMRIHGSRLSSGAEKLRHGASFFIAQVVTVSVLVVAVQNHLLSAIAMLAFLPVLVRGFIWYLPGPQKLAVRRLGWTELAHAIVFGLLLIDAFVL